MRQSEHSLKPRNGHTLAVLVVARISGCASQKELRLEDQVDHGKEVVADMYDGPIELRRRLKQAVLRRHLPGQV
jgi:hypothetical protein